MKKIAIISHGLSNGGAERVASILANNFAYQGNKILFIAAYSNKKEYKLNEKIKYKYIQVKGKNKIVRLINRSKSIKKELKNFFPDIVISFIINEMVLTNITTKIPIIYSLRIDPHDVMKSAFKNVACRISYSRAKKIVFQTPDARDYFSKKIRKKGVIIGNPLTSNLPYWREKEHKKTIITACRLTPQKNLKMLIDAYKIFRRKHKDYMLEIYGEGPLLEELTNYCFELGIKNFVKFPGHSKKIYEIMAESSIFVLSSDFEGLSNSMLEALAIGIPTICTDCPPGGASLYIQDGVNGMLVPVGNSEELANKLMLLVKNKELCKEISNESIKIRDILNENVIIQKWNNVINELDTKE